MKLFRLAIFSVFLHVSSAAFAQYEIFVINSTDLSFEVEVSQTGTETLPTNEWWGRSEEFVHWLQDTIILTVQEPQLQAEDTVEFTSVFRYSGDSIQVKQRIVSDGSANTVYYKVSGTGFSDPWTNNTSFNEQWVTIDTTLMLLKYKIDEGDSGDLQMAIHTNHIYAINPADFQNPNVLNVMSDNIMIIPLNSTDWVERASSFPQYISPYQDAVIYQEMFLDHIRLENMTPIMEDLGFVYNSTILNDTALPEVNTLGNGGVIIYSKWPIEESANHKFTTCVPGSFDCIAAKGVKYARVNKLGKNYHLFGTHMQAGGGGTYEKYKQYGESRDFIESIQISSNEPVIFGGDLNTGPTSEGSFSAILDSLNPVIPHSVGFHTSSFKRTNDIIGRIIDNIWVSRGHLIPKESNNAIISIKGINDEMWKIFEFSGHRTATGRFEYPGITAESFNGTLCQNDSLILKAYQMNGVEYTWYKDGLEITVLNDELRIENPTSTDEGVYTLEADYINIYGNTNDSLVQMFFPEGSDTVLSHVVFQIADVTYDEGCFAGLDDVDTPAVQVYPNPSSGLVTIKELKETVMTYVFSSAGKQVFADKVSPENPVIDLSELANGMYIIRLESQEGVSFDKVLLWQLE